jgi:hypothetical protein
MLGAVRRWPHWSSPLVLAALTAFAPAPAAADASVVIAGSAASCPAPAAVAAALAVAVPNAVVTIASVDAVTASARIEDLGTRYRVRVGAAERVADDPGRDCGERARVAAIFVALTLFPPAAGARSATQPTTQPATRPTTPPASRPTTPPVAAREAGAAAVEPHETVATVVARASRPRAAWHGEVELVPLVLFAPGGAGSTATAAGEVRAHVGTRRLGLTLGAEVDGNLDRTLAHGTARLSRYAFDLGAFAGWTPGRVGFVGDLGVVLASLSARGQGVGTDASSTGLEVGIRTAIGARVWLTRRIGIAANAALVAVPHRVDLVAPPVGSLGTAPRYWVTLGLGLVAQTD